MIKTMSEYDFTKSFLDSESRKDQFTYSALKAMFEYYEQIEDDCDTKIEFDMVALCCEWAEYGSAREAIQEYSFESDLERVNFDSQDEYEDELEKEALEWLQYRTQVIEFDGTVELLDGTIIGDKGVLVAQF